MLYRDRRRPLLPCRRLPHRPVEAGGARGDHPRARRSRAARAAPRTCAPTPGAGLLRRRFGADAVDRDDVPTGSAMTHRRRARELSSGRTHPRLGADPHRTVSARDGVWVVAGDYKRAADPTCAPFEPVRCDTFVTESTFGLPIYRWDTTETGRRRAARAGGAANAGARERRRCCSATRIGKAQRILAELARHTERPVFVHGMMLPVIEAYREAGVAHAAGRSGDRAAARHVVRGRARAGPALGARHAVDATARRRTRTRSPPA